MQFSHLTPSSLCFHLLFPRCFFILSRRSDSGEKKRKKGGTCVRLGKDCSSRNGVSQRFLTRSRPPLTDRIRGRDSFAPVRGERGRIRYSESLLLREKLATSQGGRIYYTCEKTSKRILHFSCYFVHSK